MQAQEEYAHVEKKAEAAATGALRAFFREYWLWIVIPFVLVLIGIVLVVWLLGGDDGASPFQYNVF